MLRKNEFPGKIFRSIPITAISTVKCYRDRRCRAADRPAIVIIPARAVLGALEQCAAVGVKNAVIISSGFAEEGGDSAAMQDAIAALAKNGMRISGPNAEGFYSQAQRLPPPSARPLPAGRAATGRDRQADRHRGAERRHRLCDLSPRQGVGHRAQLRHQRRQ
jgi:acyl-CoA synthetase (NDP forming)